MKIDKKTNPHILQIDIEEFLTLKYYKEDKSLSLTSQFFHKEESKRILTTTSIVLENKDLIDFLQAINLIQNEVSNLKFKKENKK